MNTGWPQLTVLALMALGVGISLGKQNRWDLFTTVAADAILVGLLWAGGFFSVRT